MTPFSAPLEALVISPNTSPKTDSPDSLEPTTAPLVAEATIPNGFKSPFGPCLKPKSSAPLPCSANFLSLWTSK